MIKIDETFIEKIKPTTKDFMQRRIHNISFIKIILWLCWQSQKTDFVYSSDLAEYSKLTVQRCNQVLNDLCNVEILRKSHRTCNLVEYHFMKNGDSPIILKYYEMMHKALERMTK